MEFHNTDCFGFVESCVCVCVGGPFNSQRWRTDYKSEMGRQSQPGGFRTGKKLTILTIYFGSGAVLFLLQQIVMSIVCACLVSFNLHNTMK